MTTDTTGTGPNPAQAVASAFQQWQSGQRDSAIQMVRAFADRGEPWAATLIAWFLPQMGDPSWRQAIPYAEQAIRGGYTQAANYVLGPMQGDPALRPEMANLISLAARYGFQWDPIGAAQQAAMQGDGEGALRMLAAPFSSGSPSTPEGWDDLLAHAQAITERLEAADRAVAQSQSMLGDRVTAVEAEAMEVTNRIRTQTGNLFGLIEAATNRQAEAIFDDEAAALKTEESGLWKWGIRVVIVAAVVAGVPLVSHYFGFGPAYSSASVLTAHFTAAAALGVIAGVLFARARGRDRARQRARDLTLALSTMFAYAGKIADEGERSRFTYEMGRVVIESFLRSDAPSGGDDSSGLLSALLRR